MFFGILEIMFLINLLTSPKIHTILGFLPEVIRSNFQSLVEHTYITLQSEIEVQIYI